MEASPERCARSFAAARAAVVRGFAVGPLDLRAAARAGSTAS
jgi:hypothetical protein